MKTRIISACIMIAIVTAVLFTGYKYNPIVITVFISLLSVAATYEILNDIVKTGTVFRKTSACIYAAAAFFCVSYMFHCVYDAMVKKGAIDQTKISFLVALLLFTTIVYIILFTISIIFEKKDFNITEIFAMLTVPLIYSAAFASLDCIITKTAGIYYLLLVINFSSVCDTGAYFTGVSLGHHKLCEHVSPKKTVEGAIGGIVLSLVVAVVLKYAFNASVNIFVMLGAAAVMCVVGMLGDLFASIIKRSVGVKDYSNLIPGHGGILDRFDSILFISPAMLCLILFGVIK